MKKRHKLTFIRSCIIKGSITTTRDRLVILKMLNIPYKGYKQQLSCLLKNHCMGSSKHIWKIKLIQLFIEEKNLKGIKPFRKRHLRDKQNNITKNMEGDL